MNSNTSELFFIASVFISVSIGYLKEPVYGFLVFGILVMVAAILEFLKERITD